MELTKRSVWKCFGCGFVASAQSWRALQAARRAHEEYVAYQQLQQLGEKKGARR